MSIFQQFNRWPSIPEIQVLLSRPPLLPKFTVKAGLKLPTQFGDECECMVGSYTLQGDFIELEKVRPYPPTKLAYRNGGVEAYRVSMARRHQSAANFRTRMPAHRFHATLELWSKKPCNTSLSNSPVHLFV